MSSFISTFKIFHDKAIGQNGSAEFIVDLDRYNTEGFFSLQAQVESAGAGSVTFTWAISLDGVKYITPTGASDIITALTKTGGPGSDGYDLQSFDPVPGRYLKVIATEGNVAAVTVNAFLAIQ